MCTCLKRMLHLQFSTWMGLRKIRPPQVRFDLLEMQVLKGENRTWGGLFSQANLLDICSLVGLVQDPWHGPLLVP